MTEGTGTGVDGYGNLLISRRDTQQFNLFLKLKSDGKLRRIGYIKDNVYYKHEDSNGVFRKMNAFGFCNDAIALNAPESIIVTYKGERYYISKERFDKYKVFLNWKNIGFELRCFVPLHFFKRRIGYAAY